jgi:hypothetical protein
MAKKASRRILKDEIPEREFDRDIEEAKSLRDIERLEKKDSQLWFLTIFMILVVTLFILVKDFDPLNFSPREFMNNLTSFQFSALVLPAAVVLLGFCAYALSQPENSEPAKRGLCSQDEGGAHGRHQGRGHGFIPDQLRGCQP